VRLAVADTGPIHYLILIGHIDLLPRLFERVVLPGVVLAELSHELAPASVQRWAATAPAWLEVAESPAVTASAGIHKGEAAAIALASRLHADLVLMDDRKGVIAAERQGLNVTGTLGVLDLAAERRLIDFAQAVAALKLTTFRMPLALLGELLNKHIGSGEP
jgi:predicted nucleic acid-binding protein